MFERSVAKESGAVMPNVNPVSGGLGNVLAGLLGGGSGAIGSLLGAGAGLLSGGVGQALPGLFGALLGGVAGSEGLGGEGELAAADLAALLASLKDAPASPLPDSLFVSGDSGELTVDLQQVMVQLKLTVTELKQAKVSFRDLGSAGDLASAYVKMGMSPEDAAVKATQIETMLRLVREMLDIPHDDDMTTGNLLAMVAAQASTSLTPVVQFDETSIQVTSVEAQVVVAQGKARLQAFAQHPTRQGVDLARAVAGIDLPEQTAAPDGKGLVPVVPEVTGEPGQVVAPVADDVVTATKVAETAASVAAAVVAAVQAGDGDAGGGVDGEVVAEIAHGNRGAVEAESRLAPKPVLPPVDRAQLQAPVGLEVARLVENDAGHGVVERKVSAAQLRESAPQPAGSQATAPTPPANVEANQAASVALPAKAAEATPISFAERLAQATRADVTGQTVVQVKGLLDHGGGTVRMLLNPPELGEIRVEMTVSHGKVHGSISATDGAVVELLARDVHMLRQGLADAGLKLGDQGLSLMLGYNQQQGNGQGHPHHNPHGGQHASHVQWDGEGSGDEAVTAAEGWVDLDKLVDVNV